MDIEEIETIYKQDIEKSEKSFIEGIRKQINIKNLEKSYYKDFHKAKEKYYKLMTSLIKKQKKDVWIKHKTKKKKEVLKIFKVNPANLNLNSYQKLRFYLNFKSFKYRIKIKNFFRIVIPVFIRFFFIKFRINIKKTIVKTKDKTKSFFSFIKDSVVNIISSIGEGIKDFYQFLAKITKTLSVKIKSIFKKKKKEEKPKEEQVEAKEED